MIIVTDILVIFRWPCNMKHIVTHIITYWYIVSIEIMKPMYSVNPTISFPGISTAAPRKLLMNVPLRLHGSICKRRGLKLHGIFGAAGENISGKQESRGYATYTYIYDLYQINGIRCVYVHVDIPHKYSCVSKRRDFKFHPKEGLKMMMLLRWTSQSGDELELIAYRKL